MKQYIDKFLDEFSYPEEAGSCLRQAYDGIAARQQLSGEFQKLLNSYKENHQKCDFKQMTAAMKMISAAAGIHEYTGNLLLFLCLSKRLKELYQEAGIEEEIWFTSMMDLKWKLAECKLVQDVWGTFVPDWYTKFYRMQRFGFEKLQFEIVTFGKTYEKNGVVLQPDNPVLNVHIPRTGGRLERDALERSYQLGREFFHRRFPDVWEGKPLVFVCHSWMLFPRNLELLSEQSNLRSFMADYDMIEQGEYADYSEVWRLFDTKYTGDLEKLPGNTSLRRGYKGWIERGEKTGWGYGVAVSAGQCTN